MKSLTAILIIFLTLGSHASNSPEDHKLKLFSLKGAPVVKAVKLLTDLSNMNIIVTKRAELGMAFNSSGSSQANGSRNNSSNQPESSNDSQEDGSNSNNRTSTDRTITVSLYLRNTTAFGAMKAICRNSGLTYKYDETENVYTIMTPQEYKDGLVVERKYYNRVYSVRPANVQSIATTIENIYGQRVISEDGDDVRDFSTNSLDDDDNNSSNDNDSNDNDNRSNDRSGRNYTKRYDPTDELKLNVDQTLQIERSKSQDMMRKAERILIRAGLQEPPIYLTTAYEHNQVIIRTSDEEVIAEIDDLIKQLDVRVPQVLLEMKILNLTLGDGFESAFDYQLASGNNDTFNPDSTPNKTGNRDFAGIVGGSLDTSTFAYEMISKNLKMNIELMAKDQRVEVLATPSVVAANNREAEINIVEDRPVVVGIVPGTASTVVDGIVVPGTDATTETETRAIGMTLKIIPRINEDKTVTLYIEEDSSTLLEGNATIQTLDSSGSVIDVTIDTIQTSRIKGTVVAKDQHTIAVGGLISTSVKVTREKVPFLGDIPYLGWFFRTDIKSNVKQETLLLITPHVMHEHAQGVVIKDDIIKRMSDHEYKDKGDDGLDTIIDQIRNGKKIE